MKRISLLAVIGVWAALFTGCSDSGTNGTGTHDTLHIYYYDTIHHYDTVYNNDTMWIYIGDSTALKWTIQPKIPYASPAINSLIRGGNLFVAVSGDRFDTGKIFTSPDGITWAQRTSGAANGLNKVIWAQNTYVAVGYAGTIITSPDGITWTGQTSGISSDLFDVVYGANKFLACWGDSVILTSPDGVSWTFDTANIPIGLPCYDYITWGNNRFVILQDSIFTSTDGLIWTNTGIISGWEPKLIWADSQFVAYGGEIFTSSDGLTWTNRGTPSSDNISHVGGITWGNGKFVITQGEWALTSLDGVIWNLETGCPKGANSPWRIAYGAGKFVAVQQYGAVLTSEW
jgi:hypothetical protein